RRAQAPLLQNRVVQSRLTEHIAPVSQAGHVPPPQSTSVSSRSLCPSSQLILARQVPLPQSPLSQSRSTLQALLLGPLGQTRPPQSMAVSSWFRTPSLQEGPRVRSTTSAVRSAAELGLASSVCGCRPSSWQAPTASASTARRSGHGQRFTFGLRRLRAPRI